MVEGASAFMSIIKDSVSRGRGKAPIADRRMDRIAFLVFAVIVLFTFISGDLHAKQPKNTKANPIQTQEKETKAPKDSRLSNSSWSAGVAPKGCYWACTAPNGCILDRASATSSAPVMGVSGGGRGNMFFEKTRLISAPAGSLSEANGWVRQCDKQASPENKGGEAAKKPVGRLEGE